MRRRNVQGTFIFTLVNDIIDFLTQLLKRGTPGISQSHCLMTCGLGTLWPYPIEVTGLSSVVVPIDFGFDDITLVNDEAPGIRDLLESYLPTFRNSISSSIPNKARRLHNSKQSRLEIVALVSGKSATKLNLNTDESYSLDITTDASNGVVNVKISASTYFGARHALESLSQLVAWDDHLSSLVVVSAVSIKDAPSFPYRGVMLDTARHFLPVDVIKRTIRAMSYNKLNVLHLHITDTASFPLEVPTQPNMSDYGAYSAFEVYSPHDVTDLVAYARCHGVMVLPEVDTPAHVSAGWQWGAESPAVGDLVLCADPEGTGGEQWATDSLEPPSGQLNLANERIYDVLSDVYDEVMSSLVTGGVFHIGGDEVIVGSDTSWAACYNSSTLGAPILQMLQERGLSRNDPETFYGLWQNFTKRAAALALRAYETQTSSDEPLRLHIWGGADNGDSDVCYNIVQRPDVTSVLPPSVFTIQVWDESDTSLSKWLIGQGYDIVLSNTDYVYLDCGNAGFTNPGGYWCQPYHEWFHIYDYINDVIGKWDLSDEEVRKVLGSETLPWAEMIDETNLDQKVWPRSAALAEALWSGPEGTRGGWYAADPRMQQWRNLLVRRGISAEALQPQWCQQRQAYACTLPGGTPQ